MSFIKPTGSTCYNKNRVGSKTARRGKIEINWDDMGVPHCWLQWATNQPHLIVFDKKHLKTVSDFISQDNFLSSHLIAIEDDLIEYYMPTDDIDIRRCLIQAEGVTPNGKPAGIRGIQRDFPVVCQLPDGPAYEWAWKTVLRIVNNGGVFHA